MDSRVRWLEDLGTLQEAASVDGLVLVANYNPSGKAPGEVAMMEKARSYGAYAVFFEASQNSRPPVAQAFVFLASNNSNDAEFAELHKRLWSWGGVPLVYRKLPGLVQLFRCAHQPDFVGVGGKLICKPYKVLKIGAAIAAREAWWDAEQIRNGTIWDNPATCKVMLSSTKAAHKKLITAVKQLNAELNSEGVLRRHLRRKLLILSLLIAYLEERGVFPTEYFAQFKRGAQRFFQVLADGKALIRLLDDLEERFNGHVFVLDDGDRDALSSSTQLARFAKLVEAHEEPSGQLNMWRLYSFRDLPVELISHIYQLFVTESDSSVYTPPFLVRLMLEEALSWDRLDRLHERDEIILDPACGSGVFLVEAYKRLVLHWRSKNDWKRPRIPDLKKLLKKVHGIDLEQGAVELAAFSLCLALCDALEPEEIRASIKLFPPLAGKSLHHSCFFDAVTGGLIRERVGVILGNPPFESRLATPGAEESYKRYVADYGALPDKQLAYLFLHEAMKIVAEGGILSMLQQYNFLYNQLSEGFRRKFFERWNVREILDFVSVRGLFQKGGADTKVVVVVSSAEKPNANEKVLHAVFRRSGRADAEQGFDIDYYDLHWLPRSLVLKNDGVWRADLLGGERVLSFADRLKSLRTFEGYASAQGWDFGEGFIEGQRGVSRPASHIIGKPVLPSEALTLDGIDTKAIVTMPKKPIEGHRSEKRFTPPMLLVKEHMDLAHALWTRDYLTYKSEIVGFAAPKADKPKLAELEMWLTQEAVVLRAYAACVSLRLFTRKATALSAADILALPYPDSRTLDLSVNEKIVANDIVNYRRDLIRLGEDSDAMKTNAKSALPAFSKVFSRQINEIYRDKPLRALTPQCWPGAICQPFVFGDGDVNWDGAPELKGKLDALLRHQCGKSLTVTRIARIYDGNYVFLLKSDQLRYWLQSVALRDADEMLVDLRRQGF